MLFERADTAAGGGKDQGARIRDHPAPQLHTDLVHRVYTMGSTFSHARSCS